MPDVPLRDAARVERLERLGLLDLVPEQVFDDIVALASQICGTPVALLTLLGDTEQWFKARVGMEATGTRRDVSFCTHAIEEAGLFVVEDTHLDPRFVDNPLVTDGPRVRFYMGAPFHSHDGVPLGTICVLDVVPRALGAEQRGALAALARQVEALLELRRRTIEAEERGRDLRELQALLRETNDDARREAELLAAIMAEMPEPVVLFDNEGTILRFNKAAEQSYGHRAADVIGKSAAVLQPETGCETQMAEVRAALDAHGCFRGAVTGVTKDKESFPVETAIRVVTIEGGRRLFLTVNRDLREQHRAAELLFASNELFRNAFDCAAVGMALVELGGHVQRVNPALASLFEMDPSQLVGRPVSDFVLPEALEQVRVVLPALIAADATSFHVESSIRAASGVRAVVASISVVKDIAGHSRLYAIQLQDITERRAAEAKLRESEAVFRMVAEHSSDIITRLCLDGTYLYLTPAVERITGFSPCDLVGRSAYELQHPDEAWMLETAEATLATEGQLLYQHRMLCKDGSYRWVETSARAMRDASGAIIELHAATRDISERKAAELKLIAAMKAAENANRAKSVFLGNMSHELRTPLNAILGFARVLERGRFGMLNGQQSGYVRDIIESGAHMLVLVEELLELRSLEDGLSRFVIGPVELKATFSEVMRMTYELAFEKRHTLVVEEVASSVKVVADHRAVVQVLVNLVSNAIKYTRPNGRIRVSTELDDESVTVHVEDNGVGLTVEEQSLLFREFERLGRRVQGDAPGTGLGLALTRRLVEALGGEVFVRSAPGQGSRFSFTLRRAVSSIRASLGGERYVES